jgi:hypothetical protein
MEFSSVENHDDFYTLEEGRVHVQDQRGHYVVYDVALNDLSAIENDLLLVATHFIEKDRNLRTACRVNRSATAPGADHGATAAAAAAQRRKVRGGWGGSVFSKEEYVFEKRCLGQSTGECKRGASMEGEEVRVGRMGDGV